MSHQKCTRCGRKIKKYQFCPHCGARQLESSITLGEIYQEWSSLHYRKIGKKTIEGYDNAWRHSLQPLKNIAIEDIRVSDYQKILDGIADKSQSLQHKLLLLIGQLCRYAIAVHRLHVVEPNIRVTYIKGTTICRTLFFSYKNHKLCLWANIWKNTADAQSTQLIFSDLATPGTGEWNIYDDIGNKLIARGIPKEQIAYIHDANTDAKKATLFAKMRAGKVRILMGSTKKMGAGTNVQTKLIALHHLDVPWRPSDIEQREGRILRQGNENPTVQIYRYATEGSFDAYSWQLIEQKQKFISQVMTSKSPADRKSVV